MKPLLHRIQCRRRTVIDAAMVFVIVVLIVQMWLLTATLESYLAGHYHVALPGMLTSLILFLFCWRVYRFIGCLPRIPGRELNSEDHLH